MTRGILHAAEFFSIRLHTNCTNAAWYTSASGQPGLQENPHPPTQPREFYEKIALLSPEISTQNAEHPRPFGHCSHQSVAMSP